MSDKWATDSEQTIGELQVLLAQKDVEIERLRLKLHDEEMAFAMQTDVKEAAEARIALLEKARPHRQEYEALEARLKEYEANIEADDCRLALHIKRADDAEADRDRQRSSAEKHYAESERLRELLDHVHDLEVKLAEAQAALRNDPRHWRFDWWQKAFAAEAKLTAWQAAESLPDCPACAVLDAQDGGKS